MLCSGSSAYSCVTVVEGASSGGAVLTFHCAFKIERNGKYSFLLVDIIMIVHQKIYGEVNIIMMRGRHPRGVGIIAWSTRMGRLGAMGSLH